MRKKRSRGNVFIANLPPEFGDEQLAEAFDPYGLVLSAMVARDPATGKRLRHGFVDIASERAASRAIAALNGSELDGHRLSVKVSVQPAKKAASGTPRPAARAAVAVPVSESGYQQSAFVAAPRAQRSFQVERRPLPRRI
ncbi:MAG: RNA-binding protein [Alphaproteobacteria bacterium]|nr:RNA-binding protein [Alphaproteobacteria bacterium]MBV9863161.1 RNA-binding protein [Alphaproteobacteria bacterium]